jgi:endoglucanase
LDDQIERLLGMDLAVIVDMHSVQVNEGDSVYSGDLETEDAFVEDFLLFWGGLAGHLKKYDPDMVFFEMFNEPVFLGNPSRWVDDILPRTLAAVREAAPDHTLIAEGWGWASIDGLLDVTPVADPNVVYNFHFYDPFLFTHQGADWVDEREVANLFAVPYPSDPENVVTMMFDRYSRAGQDAVMAYGAEEWNAEKLEERILRAVEWAEEHGVHIICTEFGAYAPVSPKNSRVQWITDVVSIFEKYGIGWVMWEYDAGFGFVERTSDGSANEVLEYDEGVLGALGLTLEN